MALSDQLRAESSAIAERWLADTLACYSDAARLAFRQEDPFANPVGHALRTGTRAAVEALIAGRSPSEIAACLDEIIKIRAVQAFTPSQAVGFVFLLKEIKKEIRGQNYLADSSKIGLTPFAELDRQVDQIALAVFDIYMRYRDQVCDLRINEIKRIAGRSIGQGPKGSMPAGRPHSEEVPSLEAASPHVPSQPSDGQ